MKQFIEAGEFVTTHAISGELKLYPWCDAPQFLCGLKYLYLEDNGKNRLEVEQMRTQKAMCIVKLKNIESPEAARVYIGKTVYLNREDVQLEEGAHFVQDIIGCTVKDATTNYEYGVITNVTHPGAHDVYTITKEDKDYLFPAVSEFVVKNCFEDGYILISPIDGMFNMGAQNDDED